MSEANDEPKKKQRRGKRRNYARDLQELETRVGMALAVLAKAGVANEPDKAGVREAMLELGIDLLTGERPM